MFKRQSPRLWVCHEDGYETPVCVIPVTETLVRVISVSEAPMCVIPVMEAPVTEAPVTEAPVTEAPVMEAPVTEAPVTEAPATEVPSACSGPSLYLPGATQCYIQEASPTDGEQLKVNSGL